MDHFLTVSSLTSFARSRKHGILLVGDGVCAFNPFLLEGLRPLSCLRIERKDISIQWLDGLQKHYIIEIFPMPATWKGTKMCT